MAVISPFRAWRYVPDRVAIGQVVTQPYDKITPAMQEGYYEASPYNLVRIILGRRLSADGPTDNVYTRAAASFRDWRREGTLRQDRQPAIYRYCQTFRVPGSATAVERQGWIGLGRIEEYSAGVVFRHEQTLAKPKADRLDLLRATRAHFGQIFMLYSGSGEIDTLLESAARTAPDIEVTDEYGVVHRVWKISDGAQLTSVQEKMRDRKLIIADGHHRYETALTYRNEVKEKAARPGDFAGAARAGDATAPHDWVMMTFIDMGRPGLEILPTHRVVSGASTAALESFSAEALKFFRVEEVDAAIDARRAADILKRAGQAGTALVAVTSSRALLLYSPKMVGTDFFGALSLRQQALDVVQLHRCLLEGCLRISEEAIRNQQNVAYVREADEALDQVRDGKAQIAFLMNPVRIEQVSDIAFAGDVLPQKSTDFYPKLLSGLTIYALD